MVGVFSNLILSFVSSLLLQVLVASQTSEAAFTPIPAPLPLPLPRSESTSFISPRQLITRQAAGNETTPTSDPCQTTCEALDHLNLDCPMSPDPVKCVCTESGMDSAASCLNCGLSSDSSPSAVDSAQADMDKLVNNCKEAGSPVTSRKLNSSTNGALGLAPGVALIATSALVVLASHTLL